MDYERPKSQDAVDRPLYHQYLAGDKKDTQDVRVNVHDTFSSETAYTRTRIPTPTDSHVNGQPSFGKTFATTGFLFTTIAVSTALFAVTAWFAQTAFTPEAAIDATDALAKMFKMDAGDALAILRITQGVTSTCTTMGLTAAFEMLMWALAGRPEGIPFMRFLGIAPTTTIIGVISLVVSRVTELKDRLWSILR